MSKSLFLIGWTDATIQCYFWNEIILLFISTIVHLTVVYLFVNSTSMTQTVQLWAVGQPGALATSC